MVDGDSNSIEDEVATDKSATTAKNGVQHTKANTMTSVEILAVRNSSLACSEW